MVFKKTRGSLVVFKTINAPFLSFSCDYTLPFSLSHVIYRLPSPVTD
jgi:hypothetical protein